ncbi:MAG: Fur family transcriptional regulator [Acidimicrobiales bacterium]
MEDLHETAARRVGQLSQRYTTNRRALVELLAGREAPVSIPEILELAPELAQSSAYRNLRLLEDAGVVARIVASGEFARYELAEDLTAHHHHLICRSCNAVIDFTAPAEIERQLAKLVAQVYGETGFRGERHRLDVVGACAACV